MTEQKLKELLADMTLEEKVNQMSQVVGAFFNKDMDITAMGPMADKGFTPENVALSGSILGSMGAETLKKIQKDFVEQHPHHIPMLFMLDVINGFKTIFPIPLGQGATFEPELSEKCAAVAAKEAAVSGLHVTFAPMTDLVRDARWGRVMESTGEDPYLNSLVLCRNGARIPGRRSEGAVQNCFLCEAFRRLWRTDSRKRLQYCRAFRAYLP